MNNPPPHWPRKGDILFKEGNSSNTCAWIGPNTNLQQYFTGYEDAVSIVMKEIESSPTPIGIDYMVYPIVFLSRHRIELPLKALISTGRKVLKEEGKFPTHHKLISLWNTAKGIILKIDREEVSELKVVEDQLREFDQWDFDSFVFRYPYDKKFKKNIEEHFRLDVQNFSVVSNRICKFLEGHIYQWEAYHIE